MQLTTRLALAGVSVLAALVAFGALSTRQSGTAEAHPLGNFTVNRYARIELYSDAVRVRYVVDMAEIPAFQEIEAADSNGDGAVSDAESASYLADNAPELISGLSLSIDDREGTLRTLARDISYPEGQGGLLTQRISLLLESTGARSSGSLSFRDDNYADRVGWKEILVSPSAGVVLGESTVATADVSHELTQYPGDLLSSPMDVRSASVSFDATNGAAAPPAASITSATPDRAVERAGSGFAGLIDSDHLTLTVVLLSLLAALGFGAVHALEPGHGKTFVAAYFVGVRGTAREAMLLGLIVAVTHTIGVFAIGILTLFGSQFILPEKLYPWLSLASGLMVLVLGIRLLALRYRGFIFLRRFTARPQQHDHEHMHGDGHHHHEPQPAVSPWKGLIALGLADGLTPSPSALVVLLAAISLDRIGLGVLLIVAFSVGLAAVLTLVSLGLVYMRRVLDWLGARGHGAAGHPIVAWATGNGSGEGALMTVVPVLGALALTAVGLLLTARALSGPGLPVF